MVDKPNVEQIPITDERLKAALHLLRVSFAEWQLREFPLFGFDAIKQMGMRGLCTQAEADAAIAEAEAIVWNGRRGRGDLVDALGFSISTHTDADAELFRGTIDDAELFIVSRTPRTAKEYPPLIATCYWDRRVADDLGEMHTCWSPQYQRPCVVAYFDLGDADKIITHCKLMGAFMHEGDERAYVIVLRPDVGPELYSEEAIRRNAEQFNRERALKLDRDEAADGYCGAPASAIAKIKRDGAALLAHTNRTRSILDNRMPGTRHELTFPPIVGTCEECKEPTVFACSDCAIDGKPGLHICPNRACMDAHESKCHSERPNAS